MKQESAQATGSHQKSIFAAMRSLFPFGPKPTPAIYPDSEPFVVSDHVKWFATDDGALLLDLRRDRCYSLDPVGSLTWRLLESGKTPREIGAVVARECQMSPEDVYSDIQQLISNLHASGLVILQPTARGLKHASGCSAQ